MSEINTVAVITAKPGSGDQVEQALKQLAEATHAEDGCIRYSLQRGIEDPNVFVTIEKWDSPESLQAHLGSSHIAQALSSTAEVLAMPPQIIPLSAVEAGETAKSAY